MPPVNTDHIEEDDIPKGEHIDDYIAADVWQLTRRLDLITPEGNLSSVARSMLARQRAADDYSALSETLATQIKTHYRGFMNLSIVELLQESALGLADGDSPWVGYSPGLLLIEIQYLIELAHFDADRAQQQPRLLAARRDEALSAADMAEPDPGVHDIQNTIEHADAVTELLFEQFDTCWQANHDPDRDSFYSDAVHLYGSAHRVISGRPGAMPGCP